MTNVVWAVCVLYAYVEVCRVSLNLASPIELLRNEEKKVYYITSLAKSNYCALL